jgi:hypothetical protein
VVGSGLFLLWHETERRRRVNHGPRSVWK